MDSARSPLAYPPVAKEAISSERAAEAHISMTAPKAKHVAILFTLISQRVVTTRVMLVIHYIRELQEREHHRSERARGHASAAAREEAPVGAGARRVDDRIRRATSETFCLARQRSSN